MLLKKLLFSALVALLAVATTMAQDIHFTQFTMSPLTLNPGLTGKFEGTVRIGGIYRSQWTSILGRKQYETPSAFVDAPIIRGFRKKDWLGGGLMLFQDNVGQGRLRHGAYKLSAAYHLALDKKGTAVLSIGGQYGSENYSINRDGLFFQDGYENANAGSTYGTSVDGNRLPSRDQQDPLSFNTITGGVQLSTKLNKTMDMSIGYSMFNLGQSRIQSILGTDTSTTPGGPNPTPSASYKQPRRSVINGRFNIHTNDRMTISPMFIYQTMAKQDEIIVQAMAGYLFNPERDIQLNFGAGYRLGDAANILIGARVKDLTVGFAYDVNTSGLNSDTRFRGGFEIAANYIIRIYKKATVKPKVLCPRF